MTDSLISQLFDFGALGIFAGFLIWQHLGMQKRLDRLMLEFQAEVRRFQTELKNIEDNFDERVATIRDRYEVVLSKYRQEHHDERDRLTKEINELQKAAVARERESLLNFKQSR
tara:strand:- start:676 stop:1017 length:342 start_codon:yes stop_codon:yes gene_type:complete